MNIQEANNQIQLYPMQRTSVNRNVYSQNGGQEKDSCSFTSKKQNESFLEKHWGKLILGAGAIALAAVLTKGKLWGKEKTVALEKVQHNLAEIFDKKNLSKDETETMLKKYKEIFKIKDKNEFINKAFNQIKNDFGYENIPYELEIKKEPMINNDGSHFTGGSYIEKMFVYEKDSKIEILDTISHEFKHLRQREYMFRTNPEAVLENLKEFHYKSIDLMPKAKQMMEENPKICQELILKKCNKKLKVLEDYFGHLQKYEKGSPEYSQGEKYLKAERESNNQYIERMKGLKVQNNVYQNNLLEQEAWNNGKLMQEVARYISAIK